MDNIQEQANILTEEDLNKITVTYKGFNPVLLAVIDSHRALCSANAELTFKNMKLKEFMDWAKRIIDSGMGAGILKYDPVQFFIEYHTYLKSLEVTK